MASTLQEFEAVCEELQKNPGNATKAIEHFREQDYALEACHTWIRTPGCSSLAQFQLALVPPLLENDAKFHCKSSKKSFTLSVTICTTFD